VLYISGYTDNAIVHHGRLDQGVLLTKPYRKSQMAKMVHLALDGERWFFVLTRFLHANRKSTSLENAMV
jgi:hypothetical protein